MKGNIRKAVFPVAGLGTRFLPATKANPKEMLPIVDKPLIQYAAEEAIAAGVEELVFVTNGGKRAIEDHFDKNFELEYELKSRGKHDLLAIVREVVPEGVSCIYVRQPEPLSLGHAVLCAEPVIDGEPFAVILADDLIDAEENCCLAQMTEAYAQHGGSVLGVEEVPPSDTHKYGIVKTSPLEGRVSQVVDIVEKPRPEQAPSTLAVVGRYVLTPRIFRYLRNAERGAGGEIQLTDAIAKLCQEELVLAYRFRGERFDCGDKLGYLRATVAYALKHPDLNRPFRQFLQSLCG